MKIKKIIIAGAAVAVFNVAVGMMTSGVIFNWVYKLEPTQIWKPIEGGPGVTFLAASLVLGIILSFVYALIQKGIPGGSRLMKGIVFGLCVWAAGRLPGIFATYAFMTVSTTVVVYWTILGFIKVPLEGIIIAKIYGE